MNCRTDTERLDWVIAKFQRPDRHPAVTGLVLGGILAGGEFGGTIYRCPREAIDAAMDAAAESEHA